MLREYRVVVVRHTKGGGQVDLEVTEEQEDLSGRCGFGASTVDVSWRVKGEQQQQQRSRRSFVRSSGTSSALGESPLRSAGGKVENVETH